MALLCLRTANRSSLATILMFDDASTFTQWEPRVRGTICQTSEATSVAAPRTATERPTIGSMNAATRTGQVPFAHG